MELEYIAALIPVGAGYLAWLTNRVLKLVEIQATTVTKLEAIATNQNYMQARVDNLYVRG